MAINHSREMMPTLASLVSIGVLAAYNFIIDDQGYLEKN